MARENSEIQKIKHRAVIEFLTLEVNNSKIIHDRMVVVYGTESPSYATVCRWNREFARGRESLLDDPRSGRPTTGVNQENIETVRSLVESDRRLSVRSIAEQSQLSYGTVREVLHAKLGMSKVCARWVPRMLTNADKQKRVQTSRDLLAIYDQDPERFEERIMTEDETWIHHYDPETKQQSCQWKRSEEPTPIKFLVVPSAGKVLATVFWDAKGILLLDFLPKGQTITGNYYAELLKRLRLNLPAIRRGIIRRGPLLLDDNAHASHHACCKIDCW